MIRKLVTAAVAVAGGAGLLVGVGGVASADPAPVALYLSQSQAFAILGASCGGIQEVVTTNGFDPATGYPTGVVQMKTSCGGSGRGGGYHTTTYTATADVVWDFTAAVVSTAVPATGTVTDPSFSATDASGNEVYNSGNSAYLLTAPSFVPVPRVTGISVVEGPAAGGTSVTITGTGFTGATAVSFGGVAAAFTVLGDTSITTTTPAAGPGTVDVTVTSAGGTDVPGPSDQFTFVAAPAITSLDPASGPLNGGNPIVISGSGLGTVTAVDVGGIYAAVLDQTDSSITVTAPPGEGVDSTSVHVTSIGGTASARYTYTAPDVCGAGCTFTSPATASATTGVPFTFTVSATGNVTPTFTKKGKLPKGVTFVDNYDGTATLSGTPVVVGRKAPAGTYRDKVTATFTYGTVVKKVTQILVLTVS
jgi:large repetitive protein